ncbi:MAG: hypothetical protein COB46_01325 [Rhodospirillaceae bacterium]|nr:MAG: hypothetical protein COB46_01325 [Rhodospirillaceae bacterium]
MVDNFWPDSGNMKLYEETIQFVGGKETDNLSKKMRFEIMMQLLEKTLQNNTEFDVVECGCWNGHSTRTSATLMQQNGFTGKFHVFDSFEGGLSEFTERDRDEKSAGNESQENDVRAYFESSFDAVKERLKEFNFVHFYKGWIPDRFDEVADRKFSFVNIDVDMYDPIMDSLKFFYPRLVDGGCIYLDDYNYAGFPGAKRAVDDFMKENKPTFFLRMPFGSAFIIK